MKRYLSFILVFVLMLTILPMSVYATECEDSEQETVIAQACAVFPEYAALIRGEVSTFTVPNNSDEPPVIIFQETRPLSTHERITYSQFSDGNGIIVLETDDAATSTMTGSTMKPIPGGVQFTRSYKVVPTQTFDYSGIFYLDNIKFNIYTNAFDEIDSPGTAYANNEEYCTFDLSGTPDYTEDASTKAGMSYDIYFYYDWADRRHIWVTLDISLGNDTIDVSIR